MTGLSGAGHTTALKILEDIGYEAVDNLPLSLLNGVTRGGNDFARPIAIGVDSRTRDFTAEALADQLGRLQTDPGLDARLIFLTCGDEILRRRFTETRRRHPLSPEGTVPAGIAEERKVLRDIRALADEVIDTSIVTVHELKRMIQARFADEGNDRLNVSVLSFGYRYGLPPQADLVVDVRFLPNPYFVPGMRDRTGRESDVAAYVLDREEAQAFLAKVNDLVRFLLPKYRKEGKTYLTVAVGCTGGKHRSVAFARALAEQLASEETSVRVWDRDVDKD